MLVAALQMNRRRIVQPSEDALIFEVIKQLVAVRVLNYIKMVDVQRLLRMVRRSDSIHVLEQFVVELRGSPARSIPAVQLAKLRSKHCSL